MIINYLKIALRNLIRYKVYSFISIAGLTLGLVCGLAMLLHVQDELNYDQYHSRKERIYRLVTTVANGSYEGIAKVHGPWGPTAISELPEVETMARFVIAGQTLFTKEEIRFYENNGLIADSSVFDIFDFKMITGDPQTALKLPDGIVITESLAKKYFGNQNPQGKLIKLDNQRDVTVTAVIQDVPVNSHFKFSFLLPMSGYNHPQVNSWTQWNQFYTYLLLKEGADAKIVANKFKELLPSYLDKDIAATYSPFLQPITAIHLHSNLFRELNPNSDISYVYIFSAIGILILVISSINFINLTTARALTRLKEVGIRKSSGAIKSQLIVQYLSESITISLLSLVLAFILLTAILPSFNTLIGKNLYINSNNFYFSGIAIFISLLVGLLSGSYPAFYLARQRPSEVLKGKIKTDSRQVARQTLVVAQFVISILLIVSSIVIFKQLDFIQRKKLGFNPSELITVPIQANVLREKSETIKNELTRYPSIESVSISGGQPGGNDWGIPYAAEGFEQDQLPPMRVLAVDQDFVKTFEMELVLGRGFKKELVGDSAAYILNEEAVRQLGWDDPLSKSLSMPAIGKPPGPVIGILKDFHFRSMKEKIGPVMLFMPPSNWFGIYTIRIKTGQVEEGLKAIEKVLAEFDPEHPLTYSFFDETYGQLYQSENRLADMMGLFTGIGIFIACLGLFSLAAFMIEQRTKEIGIRKVMGASIKSITLLLTRDLAILVFVGFIIAVPIGYYIMKQWLAAFAYQTTISASVFVATGVGISLLAWITIGYKVLNAGLTNPIDSLRSE